MKVTSDVITGSLYIIQKNWDIRFNRKEVFFGEIITLIILAMFAVIIVVVEIGKILH